MLTPLDLKAPTSGPMGLTFMRALPVRIVADGPSFTGEHRATTVARKRDAVPALPRYSPPPLACRFPPLPLTSSTSPASSQVYEAPPSCLMAESMYSVSSEWSRFLMRQVPRPRAAKTNARLEILFDPGGAILTFNPAGTPGTTQW